MTTHRLVATQLIRRPIDEVFTFFARPGNLARLTPPSMGFDLRTLDVDMRPGLEIEYRIRPLLGVPMTWRSRIDNWDPPNGFRDVQVAGPYRRWEHDHSFLAVAGGTLVRDEVVYELPFEPLGGLVHRLAVRGELERIFRYRASSMDTIFAAAGEQTGRTVAVVGGTGFVGGAIAAELRRRGDRVVVLSHRGEAGRGPLPDDVEIRQADVTDEAVDVGTALSGADAIVIALAFPNSPIEAPRRGRTFEAVDARGTERVAAAARASGATHLAYVSGAGAAPDAARHWFRAKWRAEEAVRASGITWTIVRPTWIYGPRDVALNRFVGFARRLPFVPMTNTGRQLMAPVFVGDVARFIADALVDERADDQVFEIGGPDVLPMRGVIGRALRVAGLRRPILPGPTPLLKLATAPLTLLPTPPLTPSAIDFINQPATVETDALLARMPRRLTRLEEGLATYLAAGSRADRSLEIDAAKPRAGA